jgi:transcriptional regulator with XRE-family HTH domain
MSNQLKQSIGTRVQAARRRAKLSQEGLAAKIDRTPESISNIERGVQLPNLETLVELARVLDLPLTVFFEGLERKRVISPERAKLEAELREITRDLAPKTLKIALEQIRVLKTLG